MKCTFLFLIGFLMATSASAGDMMIKVQKVKRVSLMLARIPQYDSLRKIVPSAGEREEGRYECLQVTGLFEGSTEPRTYATCSCTDTYCNPPYRVNITTDFEYRIADNQLNTCETNFKLAMLRPGQFGIDMANGWCAVGTNAYYMGDSCWALNGCELQTLDK